MAHLQFKSVFSVEVLAPYGDRGLPLIQRGYRPTWSHPALHVDGEAAGALLDADGRGGDQVVAPCSRVQRVVLKVRSLSSVRF